MEANQAKEEGAPALGDVVRSGGRGEKTDAMPFVRRLVADSEAVRSTSLLLRVTEAT